MALAKNFAPEEITKIAKEYGQQLEFEGKFSDAKKMYEKALETAPDFVGKESELFDHEIICSHGLTRMTFRLGEIKLGMKMVLDCLDQRLLIECGNILKTLKQYNEASLLFENAQKWELACEMYMNGYCF